MNNKFTIISDETKIYKSLSACCRCQSVLPGGVQPVFSMPIDTRLDCIGFAKLPAKIDGKFALYTR